jgi:4,5-dihydroxyphthalate decarboxylase
MGDLELTYAGLLYLDRTLPLLTGEVRPSGVDLRYEVFPRVEDLFRRQAQHAEFPVSEMSLGTFLVLTARGDAPFVGLPVFLSRHFRHREVYVNERAGITEPTALRGKRVAVPEYQMTAAVWVRGILRDEYGIEPEEIDWHTGGLREPAYAERLAVRLPAGVEVRRIPVDRTLEEMLQSGDLDALITTEQPPAMREPGSPIRRLFTDYGEVERAYYSRTGIFPIMHLLVVRRDVYEANPWVAKSLTDAFTEAKAAGNARLRFQPSLPVGLPWLQEAIEEVDRDFDGDAFPYGVEPNRHVLDVMTRYMHEQGLTARRVGVDELFAPEATVVDGAVSS